MADAVSLVLFLGLICGSLWLWMAMLIRVASGQAILAALPRRPVPWQVWDVLAVVLLYVLLQYGALLAALMIAGVDLAKMAEGPKEPSAELLVPALLGNGIANLMIVGLTVLLFRWRARATLEDFGVRPWRPLYDAALGCLAFLAALAPVYAIQWALTQFFPSVHPISELLKKSPDSSVLLVCAFSAVLVAPLAEEFLFRVVLQGWLESVEMYWRTQHGRRPDADTILPEAIAVEPEVASQEPSVVTDDANPYRSPTTPGRDLDRSDAPNFWRKPGRWPIVLSSTAFALVHLGHGPDPIPLFILALILGYLYQRTHRIWPCVVLHMCLNAVSLTVLWLSVKYGPPPV